MGLRKYLDFQRCLLGGFNLNAESARKIFALCSIHEPLPRILALISPVFGYFFRFVSTVLSHFTPLGTDARNGRKRKQNRNKRYEVCAILTKIVFLVFLNVKCSGTFSDVQIHC